MTNTQGILIAGLICIAMRIVPALFLQNRTLSQQSRGIMSYIPLTVFSVIVALDVFFWEGSLNLNPFVNLKLVASLMTVLCAFWSKDLIKTVTFGIIAISVVWLISL